jgi:hypothetical protein
MANATYVYCLIGSSAKPRLGRTLKGLPGSGPIRLVTVDSGIWLAVADVPLAVYGEKALTSELGNLDWVSETAVAHERVVESFRSADAVLPMKLFTIFESDARARRNVEKNRQTIDRLITRVAKMDEWGVRLALGRSAQPEGSSAVASVSPRAASGASYLRRKKKQRDDSINRVHRAKAVAAELFDTLAIHSAEARKRPATELPAGGGVLILDAAFLVPRSRSRRLMSAAARQARALSPEGYAVSITGPWPPYSFMQD